MQAAVVAVSNIDPKRDRPDIERQLSQLLQGGEETGAVFHDGSECLTRRWGEVCFQCRRESASFDCPPKAAAWLSSIFGIS